VGISDRNHEAGVVVKVDQRVLATSCFCFLDEGPAAHKVGVGSNPSQLARHDAVYGLHGGEVDREEYIEEALVDQRSSHGDGLPLKPGLHDRRINAPDSVWKVVEVGHDKPVSWEVSI